MLLLCCFDFSVDIRDFVIGLSHISFSFQFILYAKLGMLQTVFVSVYLKKFLVFSFHVSLY